MPIALYALRTLFTDPFQAPTDILPQVFRLKAEATSQRGFVASALRRKDQLEPASSVPHIGALHWLMAAVSRLLIVLVALTLATATGAAVHLQPPPDIDALVKNVRESIRREYAEPVRFNYIEEGRDVDVSMLGKVSVGPLQTFEVRQNPPWDKWKRLIAIDG